MNRWSRLLLRGLAIAGLLATSFRLGDDILVPFLLLPACVALLEGL